MEREIEVSEHLLESFAREVDEDINKKMSEKNFQSNSGNT